MICVLLSGRICLIAVGATEEVGLGCPLSVLVRATTPSGVATRDAVLEPGVGTRAVADALVGRRHVYLAGPATMRYLDR